MNKYEGKVKINITLILVLAMMIQIVSPSILNITFAEDGVIEPEVVDEIQEEEGEPEPEEPETTESLDEEGEENVKDEVDEEPPQEEEEPVKEEEEAVEKDDESEAEVDSKSDEVESFSVGPQADLGNIFTNPRLTLNGEEIQDGDIIDIDDNTTVQLEYDWHTEDLDVSAGDTVSIQLPDIFRQINRQNEPVITGGVTVGTYSIVDGQLTFTFNEEIEDGNVSNGVLGLNLQFNMEKFEESIRQRIEFNDRDQTILDVIARPTGDIRGITKKGSPDREMNARKITWTIDVMNNNDEPITESILRDIIPEGVGAPRDFVINELSVGFNGDKRVGNEVDIEPQIEGNEFTIEFPETAPFNGYRVEYTTTIEDYTKDNFKNDAEFSYDDTKLPAEATVFAGNRSNPIEKSGNYNRDTGQIDWTINVNESGGEIDEAIVHDTLPEELKLVDGSIVVDKFDSDWNRLESVDIDEIDFPINLGKIEANEIYQIKFSTDIDWSKVNGGEYQHYNEFTNKTELYDDDTIEGGDDATVEIERDSLLEKSGNANGFNYEDKILNWEITVNKAGHPITNAVLTDTLPAGLGTILPEDITIEGADVDSDNIIITQNGDGTQRVVINLGDIDSEVTVSYQTEVEDFDEDSFKNTVRLDGEGIGEDTPKNETTVGPPANSFDKSYERIDYNAKTIDWSLTVNPAREAITSLTITDTFPNDGLFLLEDSVEVTLGGEAFDDYTLAPINGSYHNGFTIVTNADLDGGELVVTYTTSYDPDVIENPHISYEEDSNDQSRRYINHAKFTGETENGHGIDTEDEAYVDVREDSWNSGKKEGQLVREDDAGNLVNGWQSGSERKIAWQLYTNYQEQNLGTGVVITDTLDYEGTIDEGSVVVKVYNVATDGWTTIKEEVLSDENYEVKYDGDSFTLKFNENFVVDERYVVEFTTTVPDISQPSYTNNA